MDGKSGKSGLRRRPRVRTSGKGVDDTTKTRRFGGVVSTG